MGFLCFSDASAVVGNSNPDCLDHLEPPNLPWDATTLWVADLEADGTLKDPQVVAGGPDSVESIFQPQWAPDGSLIFVSDRGDGWWNLYQWKDGGEVVPLCSMEAEVGVPQWSFRLSTYGFRGEENKIVCAYTKNGFWHLATVDLASKEVTELTNLPFTYYEQVRVCGNVCVFVGASAVMQPCIVKLQLDSGEFEVIRRSSSLDFDETEISIPESIEFLSVDGRKAYAFFYKPKNSRFVPPEGELPPLVVKSHGGPTDKTKGILNFQNQFWTSRGFAVLDVNYGGSVGYGRAYRELLKSNWGVVDMQDCSQGAVYLAKQGLVDPNKLAITGGSAGGYTTLSCLAFTSVFRAGASYYGIADLGMLAGDCHKFESRYLDGLVAPYSDETKDLYDSRSPLKHADQISCPCIFFQGLDDPVVPPSQPEAMVKALKDRGVKVEYVTYEGESHVFGKAESIRDSLEKEVAFFLEVFEGEREV